MENSKAGLSELADSLIDQHRIHEAWQIYQQLCNLDPHDVEIWCMWGVLDSELGQLNLASEKFHKALTLDPLHAKSNYGLANIHAQQGRMEEAQD
jgi:tetratricopeptide (TPR) repeat protein